MPFDPNRKKKIMSILEKDILSQRENRTLLKRTVQMVMLSVWLPHYMEYAFKAWFYRKNRSKYFWEHIWNKIFHWNFTTCLWVQKRYAAKLFHWNDIRIKINRNFGGIQSRMNAAMHIYPIFKKIRASWN